MKRIVLVSILCFTLLLSGCSLLPQEPQLQITPVLPEYEKPVYRFATVQREDLLLAQYIPCTYLSVQSESLSFSVDGLYFDTFFVSSGDWVEAGQLLVQLDCTDIQKEVDSCQLSLKRLDLQLSAIEEDRSLAKQRQKILLQDAPAEELQAALSDVDQRYNAQRKSVLSEKELLQMELDGYQQQLSSRKLYAGTSGIVTYLYQPKTGTRSKANQRIATIIDPNKYVFRANTDSWHLFPEGSDFTVINKTTYAVTVVSAASLGLTESEKVEGKPANVYFQLHSPAPELEDGDSGTVILQLDFSESALVLPEKAVDTINGQSVVYYLDEYGLKSYKPVQVGLKAGGKIEILSGLAEGDQVIIG